MADAPKGGDGRLFLKGNEAVARGALAAGVRCYFGYPITPQNEIPEFLSTHLPAASGQFVQCESEIGAANLLLGAAAAGVRAMTSSSSPGISLKQEAISYMAGSDLPAVIVNMNRGGPGLGDLGPSQGDYYQATRGGGHGDYRTLVLAPATCQEGYDLTILAFDLAFRYQIPVLVLGDAILAQMKEPVRCWQPDPHSPDEGAAWQVNGAQGRPKRLIKSLRLEEGALAAHNRHLGEKHQRMEAEVRCERYYLDDAELVVTAYGSIGRIALSAVRMLRREGLKVGLLRPVTLYPFPTQALAELAATGRRFLTIEQNLGQMVDDVRLAVRHHADSGLHAIMPGELPTADDLVAPIRSAMGR